jgi:mannose-P-dolichol utilization defect protein 1
MVVVAVHSNPVFAVVATVGKEACLAQLLALDLSSVSTCWSVWLTKLLGVVIIAASFALKVPQIVKIVKNKSVAGLSFSMFTLELFGFIFQGSYAARHGFPLDSYLEVFVILAQNFIIVALCYVFTTGYNVQAAALQAAALALLFWELYAAPLEYVVLLQSLAIGIFTIAKLPQIVQAFQNKSTGQLDLFMVLLQTLGSLVRVFTTLQTVDNPVYLFGYILGASLNGIITAQVLYYGAGKKAPATAGAVKSPKAKKID